MTNLSRVLKQRHITGKNFAKMCGMSSSSIYKYLCGCRRLSLRTARRFAHILEVSPEELLGEAEEN